ncbi:MAG: DsbA family oxidoreductase [Alphaproteobacteria bacterium]|nr:DsbA family oxidoreductase [Alphaproteobacteria bacterium]
MITIDIVSDTVCPWCFIGKRRLERALAERGTESKVFIGWRPFQLNPDMPAEGMDRKDYLAAKFGGEQGAQRVYDNIRQAGQSEGIEFNFNAVGRTPNTINSHRLIDRAGQDGKQDAVVEALFQGYFVDGQNIGDTEVLVNIGTAGGLDPDATRAYLESDEDVERIRGEDAMARRMGVQGVPCFILNRKYAISGAQDPQVFLQAIAQVEAELAQDVPTPAEQT